MYNKEAHSVSSKMTHGKIVIYFYLFNQLIFVTHNKHIQGGPKKLATISNHH